MAPRFAYRDSIGYTAVMVAPEPKARWYRLTPDRLIAALLAVEGFLLLSERFRWFPFNQHKGWTVLIAIASVGVAMLLMFLWFLAALLFRRRFQYSIRSLFVLTVAVAIPCSWLAAEMKKARKQKEAVKAIKKLGAMVGYYHHFLMISKGGTLTFGDPRPPCPTRLQTRLGDDFFVDIIRVDLHVPVCGRWTAIGQRVDPTPVPRPVRLPGYRC